MLDNFSSLNQGEPAFLSSSHPEGIPLCICAESNPATVIIFFTVGFSGTAAGGEIRVGVPSVAGGIAGGAGIVVSGATVPVSGFSCGGVVGILGVGVGMGLGATATSEVFRSSAFRQPAIWKKAAKIRHMIKTTALFMLHYFTGFCCFW